ncbi:MAG: zinc-ribbon domain-containing protein, partial [Acidobacteria bacterium]|nr:zinc-ribbon domain-containing protein [Acidobacteriota bacterium]
AQRKLQPTEEYVCSKCGFENPLPVKFCGECGAPISPRVHGS